MSLLCALGIHKWRRNRTAKTCERCGKFVGTYNVMVRNVDQLLDNMAVFEEEAKQRKR
jgi:hypothetical protein